MWVYESESMEALRAGEVRGRWELGVQGSCFVGSLVWLRAEAHVMRLRGDLSGDWWRASSDSPPWARYLVGSPKKKSNRGAHLKGKGNEVAVKSVASRRAELSVSGTA